nr:hypothetical protein [Phytoactinopolyspora limicola]
MAKLVRMEAMGRAGLGNCAVEPGTTGSTDSQDGTLGGGEYEILRTFAVELLGDEWH